MIIRRFLPSLITRCCSIRFACGALMVPVIGVEIMEVFNADVPFQGLLDKQSELVLSKLALRRGLEFGSVVLYPLPCRLHFGLVSSFE